MAFSPVASNPNNSGGSIGAEPVATVVIWPSRRALIVQVFLSSWSLASIL
jgi:hypothetical protein